RGDGIVRKGVGSGRAPFASPGGEAARRTTGGPTASRNSRRPRTGAFGAEEGAAAGAAPPLVVFGRATAGVASFGAGAGCEGAVLSSPSSHLTGRSAQIELSSAGSSGTAAPAPV